MSREGDVVALYDGRSNAELFLGTGKIEDQNPSDSLFMTAELVRADRLFTAKKSILDNIGYSTSEVRYYCPEFDISFASTMILSPA